MPQLAGAGYRVIAVDPRGMGESDAPVGSYDMATVSTELHHFASQIGLFENGPIDVVGPDVGSWIAYAWAVDWRSAIRRVAMFDRSEENTSELQSLMRFSYSVFCLKKNTDPSHI